MVTPFRDSALSVDRFYSSLNLASPISEIAIKLKHKTFREAFQQKTIESVSMHGAVRGSGQGLFPSRLCPPLISRGVMA